MSPDPVTVPPLATIPGVELCAVGAWHLSTGWVTFTTEDFAAAVEAAQCPAVGAPVLKLGHVDPRFDGEPAVGHVTNLAVTGSGAKLTGDYAGLPGWLGTELPDGGSVIGSAYPQRSVEGTYDLVCSIGHTHPFVITAVALLGVARPGVGVLSSLDSVAELYGVSASTQARAQAHAALIAAAQAPGRPWKLEASMPEPAPAGTPVFAAGVTTEDVRRAYYETSAGSNYNLWIMEMQLSPPQLIVCDDATSKVYRVPVSIKGNAVTFADPTEVEVEYVDVAATLAASRAMLGLPAPAAVWASAADSRPAKDVQAWDGAAAVKNLGDDPSKAQLKKLFALPGDTKSDSKLPHHTVSADGTVGAADDTACSAAIAALNGGRGGLKGVSDADVKKAYSHLAAHLKADGKDVPELKASADPEPPDDDIEAGSPHGAYTGTHSHPHAAMGGQGDDQTHEHSHTHSGDASHAHVHAAGADHRKESSVDFTPEQETALRAKLGLAEDAELTPEALMTLAEAPKGTELTASQMPAGTVVLDREQWEQTQARIKKGEDAHKEQQRVRREAALDAAIAAGKFSPARREHWARAWDSNPDNTEALLAGMTPGVVPVDDIGKPGGPQDIGLDAEFAHLFPPEPARGGQG